MIELDTSPHYRAFLEILDRHIVLHFRTGPLDTSILLTQEEAQRLRLFIRSDEHRIEIRRKDTKSHIKAEWEREHKTQILYLILKDEKMRFQAYLTEAAAKAFATRIEQWMGGSLY